MEADSCVKFCTCLLLSAREGISWSNEHPYRIADPWKPCPIHIETQKEEHGTH